MKTRVVIESRFRGPPSSANGGYACGLVAEGVDGVASVTLWVPPPLDTPMDLAGDGEQSRLMDGDVLVGEAKLAVLDMAVPTPPSLEAAIEASERYVGFDHHPYETCFVCGPVREPGDGLRIFPGAIDAAGLVVGPWTPDETLVSADGTVDRRHVWAALDCPSYFGLVPSPMALLGRLTAEIDRGPEVGEPLIAMGWAHRSEGRKHFSGSALASGDGEVLARADAIWIELKDSSARSG